MKCYVLYFILCIHIIISYTQEFFETVETVVGQNAEIPCIVKSRTAGDKLNVLTWYKQNIGSAIYSSRDLRGDSKESKNNTGIMKNLRYRLVEAEGVNRLVIHNIKPEDSGHYYCHAIYATSPARKTYVHLTVIEPPKRVFVVHENGSRVAVASANTGFSVNHSLGPYYVGDMVHLYCVSYGGRPQPSLSWSVRGRSVRGATTALSEDRVRADLAYGPLRREDHGCLLTCRAHNNNVSIPLTVDITLHVFLPPEHVTVRAADTSDNSMLREGETLRLQCVVGGARPWPSVVWFLNDNQLINVKENFSAKLGLEAKLRRFTVNASQRLFISEAQLFLDGELDKANISCCASAYSRTKDYECSQKLQLFIEFTPKLTIVVDGNVENNTLNVVKGSELQLHCEIEANPPIDKLVWYHGEDVISVMKSNSSVIQAALRLPLVAENDTGEYVCAAANNVASSASDPLFINVIYSPICNDKDVNEYGLGENEYMNLTCDVTGNPDASSFGWILLEGLVNFPSLKNGQNYHIMETTENVLEYMRPSNAICGTVFCWGMNGVKDGDNALPQSPCAFIITAETTPQPPTNCEANKNAQNEIIVTCTKGHNGGLPQIFTLMVMSLNTEKMLTSVTHMKPQFILQEPTEKFYKLVIFASNEKGESKHIVMEKDDVTNETDSETMVSDITTLALALCAGVALLALAACGLVLCARERDGGGSGRARERDDDGSRHARGLPALCAYNTDESNCETFRDSDDGSEYNMRRTDSFRRAMPPRTPPKGYDVRRTSSFHSARYIDDDGHDELGKCGGDTLRHSAGCRMRSLQNICNKRRDMENLLCDHLMMTLPGDAPSNAVPKSTSSFYTMPRRVQQKLVKDISDEVSEITQNSDGFSLPPPPDEFSSYRAGPRISARDILKPSSNFSTIRKNIDKDKTQYSNVIISPMNTVGLPIASGTPNILYTYPDDETQNATTRESGAVSTFQTYSSPKESGF